MKFEVPRAANDNLLSLREMREKLKEDGNFVNKVREWIPSKRRELLDTMTASSVLNGDDMADETTEAFALLQGLEAYRVEADKRLQAAEDKPEDLPAFSEAQNSVAVLRDEFDRAQEHLG
ncbi:MAG: hypothetical protein UY98_C0029G0004 [Candidatus Kaiserbacteria bacterium GW2011_GWA2_58_9]|uniref:Uncharacterized protein n=1 Tax=Candidatus Kaiserbacteria bacterium GW2011_GWA2_58_9 TaxID=1618672 RepID=A0A0G2AXT9_9BACT|nr:MAG: hypothetical protein UY98_C0029G0004 [Candidatus Kaiserbacteria bacterium GW2011_GWA2_58_9]